MSFHTAAIASYVQRRKNKEQENQIQEPPREEGQCSNVDCPDFAEVFSHKKHKACPTCNGPIE